MHTIAGKNSRGTQNSLQAGCEQCNGLTLLKIVGDKTIDYKVMRDRIEDIVNDNHRDFVKAMISIEKGINDESVLDKLYDAYMDNDSLNLLQDEFDYMIEKLSK